MTITSCDLQSNRLGIDISFSDAGGVEIEENWDKVKQITVPTGEEVTGDLLAPLLVGLPLELRGNMERFIQGCFGVCARPGAIVFRLLALGAL